MVAGYLGINPSTQSSSWKQACWRKYSYHYSQVYHLRKASCLFLFGRTVHQSSFILSVSAKTVFQHCTNWNL